MDKKGIEAALFEYIWNYSAKSKYIKYGCQAAI